MKCKLVFLCLLYQNSPNDIISGTLTVKKMIKMRFFCDKRYITFLLRMTQILHIPKITVGVSRTLSMITIWRLFWLNEQQYQTPTYLFVLVIVHQMLTEFGWNVLIVLAGDFNLPRVFWNSRENSTGVNEKTFIRILDEYFLEQMNKFPTRETISLISLLAVFLIRCSLKLKFF